MLENTQILVKGKNLHVHLLAKENGPRNVDFYEIFFWFNFCVD